LPNSLPPFFETFFPSLRINLAGGLSYVAPSFIMIGLNFLMRVFVIWVSLGLFISVLPAAKERLRTFQIGKVTVSSILSPEGADTHLFLSYHLLENTLMRELKKVGIEPRDLSRGAMVEFNGSQIIIRGVHGLVPFVLNIDGGFYQNKEQEEDSVIFMDFKITFFRHEKHFLESLLDLVTLPVGMVFETVLNVIFASTSITAGIEDYVEIEVDGTFQPLTFLKRIYATLRNLVGASEDATDFHHEGVVSVQINQKARALLEKMNRFELGATPEGLKAQF
jgi:hypothetical protein